jgi:AcrR family transcriptional regulator
MGRPKLHGEETRGTLLRVAEELTAKEGIGAVTVRRVAEASGTTTRAVYTVFGSRDALISALYEKSFRMLSLAVDSVPLTNKPILDVVHAGVDGFRKYALAHPNLYRLVFEHVIDMRRIEPAALAVGLEALHRLKSRVQRCANAGLISKSAVLTLTIAFDAVCRGLATMELNCFLQIPGETVDPRKLWQQSLQALVAGFQKRNRD